jgi:hypothetical protein
MQRIAQAREKPPAQEQRRAMEKTMRDAAETMRVALACATKTSREQRRAAVAQIGD